MKKRYYNAASLERDLRAFEECYGLTSDAFYRAHEKCKAPTRVSMFDRVVWADLYREYRRLREREPASRRAALQPAG